MTLFELEVCSPILTLIEEQVRPDESYLEFKELPEVELLPRLCGVTDSTDQAGGGEDTTRSTCFCRILMAHSLTDLME